MQRPVAGLVLVSAAVQKHEVLLKMKENGDETLRLKPVGVKKGF